jgi:DNA-binding XRE family transcriptional regulator
MAGKTNWVELKERQGRAQRLVAARKRAKMRPKEAAEKTGINLNTLKAHESGRNGFSPSDALKYAKAYETSEHYLIYGPPTDKSEQTGVSGLAFLSHKPSSKLAQEVDEMDALEQELVAEFVELMRRAKQR